MLALQVLASSADGVKSTSAAGLAAELANGFSDEHADVSSTAATSGTRRSEYDFIDQAPRDSSFTRTTSRRVTASSPSAAGAAGAAASGAAGGQGAAAFGGFGGGQGTFGSVKSVEGNTIELSTAQAAVKVTVNDQTTVQQTVPQAVPLNQLQPGTNVMVVGDRDAQGNMTARSINVLPQGTPGRRADGAPLSAEGGTPGARRPGAEGGTPGARRQGTPGAASPAP